MRREVRLYNLILPVWALWLFPQAWLVVLPGNLLVDGLVFFLTLTALRRADRGALLKTCLWKLWLCGFAADLAGVLWLLLGFLTCGIPGFWGDAISYITHDPFGHPRPLPGRWPPWRPPAYVSTAWTASCSAAFRRCLTGSGTSPRWPWLLRRPRGPFSSRSIDGGAFP